MKRSLLAILLACCALPALADPTYQITVRRGHDAPLFSRTIEATPGKSAFSFASEQSYLKSVSTTIQADGSSEVTLVPDVLNSEFQGAFTQQTDGTITFAYAAQMGVLRVVRSDEYPIELPSTFKAERVEQPLVLQPNQTVSYRLTQGTFWKPGYTLTVKRLSDTGDAAVASR